MARKRDPRCAWNGSAGRCLFAGSSDGLCAWHYQTRHGKPDDYEHFAKWRQAILQNDRRWALYSAGDCWRLLNGTAVPFPECAGCGSECRTMADYSATDGIALPPEDATHDAGQVWCIRCPPAWVQTGEKEKALKEKTKPVADRDAIPELVKQKTDQQTCGSTSLQPAVPL